MVGNRALLRNINKRPIINITVGNGARIKGEHQGELQDVLYVPDLSCNLISVAKSPGKWEFAPHSAALTGKDGARLATAHLQNGLYTIKTGTLDLRI
ncbi:hypothetical protein Q5752_003348 [Cryptotrichosporon argae]